MAHNVSFATKKGLTFKNILFCIKIVMCLLRNLYAGQEASYNWTWDNRLVPNGKRSVKAVYCHPAYLTYMHSTS